MIKQSFIFVTILLATIANAFAHTTTAVRSGWSLDFHSPNMIVGSPSCEANICFQPIVLAEPEKISFVLKLALEDGSQPDPTLTSLKEHYAFLDIFKVGDDYVRFTKITTNDGVTFLKPSTVNGNYLIINKLLDQPTVDFYQVTSFTRWEVVSEGFASQYKLLLAFKDLYSNAI